MVTLKTTALMVAVGKHLILKGVDVEVKGGEIIALMGLTVGEALRIIIKGAYVSALSTAIG